MKRVKQISVDILVDENVDGCKLAEQIAKDLENEGHIILGSAFQEDITEAYKKDYLELLEDTEEDKNENWGEEICPYCDHVNDFVWEEGTKRTIICKNCGKEILLCSLCDMDVVSCGKCPYDNREE